MDEARHLDVSSTGGKNRITDDEVAKVEYFDEGMDSIIKKAYDELSK